MKEFGELIHTVSLNLCTVCSEAWPIFGPTQSVCQLCVKSEKRRQQFSNLNFMHPGQPPSELPILSCLEESLIALHCPVLKVFRLKGGSFGYSGNVVAVTQDIGGFVNLLPRRLSEVELTIVMPFYSRDEEAPKSLRVSHHKIRLWLHFLISRNPIYSNISIDEEALISLPENGNSFAHLLEFVQIAAADDSADAVEDLGIAVHGVMGDADNQTEEVLIENLVWPERSADAIKEFNHPNIFAKCFPTIFPWGIGDPTSPSRPHVVTLSDGIGHLERYAYFSQSQNRIVWPFGEHAIAPFYTFDVKTRQSLLQQSGIFLKQTGDFPTTIQDLRQQLQDLASKSKILKQMGRCVVYSMIYDIDDPTCFVFYSCCFD